MLKLFLSFGQLSFLKVKSWNFSVIVFLYLFFLIGSIFHIVLGVGSWVVKITEPLLLLTNFLVLIDLIKSSFIDKKILIWITVSFVATLCLEILGVATGQIFGSYNYGSVFQLKIFNVPWLIGLNWVIVVLGAYLLTTFWLERVLSFFSQKTFLNLYRKFRFGILPILCAVLIVIFDWILEPVAVFLDYWQWQNNLIPIQNYIAWFIISLVLVFWLEIFKVKVKSNLAMHYFLIFTLFLLILRVFMVK